MCFSQPKIPTQPTPAAPIIAAADNSQATASATAEAILRRRRAGAAANILPTASGIPSTRKLGQPA